MQLLLQSTKENNATVVVKVGFNSINTVSNAILHSSEFWRCPERAEKYVLEDLLQTPAILNQQLK